MHYHLSRYLFYDGGDKFYQFFDKPFRRRGLKEIGIRKVLGGCEKLIDHTIPDRIHYTCFISDHRGHNNLRIHKKLFWQRFGKRDPPAVDISDLFYCSAFSLAVSVGLLAGIYPAFVLSSMKSVDSLKGKLANIKDRIWLRKSLVGFQFGIAAIVFVSAIVVSKQIKLFLAGDLGFDRDYIVSAQVPRNWTPEGVRKMETFRKQFEHMAQVTHATLSFEVPDGNSSGTVALYKVGSDSTTAISSQLLMTDENYSSTFGIPMAAGQFFSAPGAFTDSSKIVINETQARAFGWNNPQDAIGKQMNMRQSGGFITTIVGVTKDFHFGSMQNKIPPATFLHVNLTNTFRLLSFKLNGANAANTIAALQKSWSALMPGTPFEYTFMDESLAKLYRTELQLKKASYTATVLAFIIVLLGVLGLVSLSVQKRIKEIGIRKVLGSSVTGIIALFMKDFLLVIVVSGVVACPLAYILMKEWLNEYAYKTPLTIQPFIIAITVLGGITTILISLQTHRAANANPTKNLRTE